MTEALISLLITTILLLGSPGPATLALAATGATVGFRRGTPFLFGILLGLLVAITGAAVGLASLFTNYSELRVIAQVLGGLYIVYIALKIATSPIIDIGNAQASTVPRFRDGFILNLLNVKAYAVFLAVFSQFLLPFDQTILAYVSTGFVCIVVATTVDIIWLWFGSVIAPFFTRPREARILRIVFAVLMVSAVAFVFML
ncbi:MAG: lysine transporter LysE [SAR86 cluster bacterium]|uniref:Lysine transporter LysE n=1 Tax=SAR86 cluster bacterium TaxID=2030880 RepID=A0A2A5AE30_9GAMM|nr:MAG: lysine transporter LysE [SAR86 cluster bacterium]